MHVDRKMEFDLTLSSLKKLYNKITQFCRVNGKDEVTFSRFHATRTLHFVQYSLLRLYSIRMTWNWGPRSYSCFLFIYWSHKVLLSVIFRAESFVRGFWLYANYFLQHSVPPVALASTALSLELFLCSEQLYAVRKVSHPENTKLIAFPIRKWRQSCSQTQFKNLREKKEAILLWNEAQWKASINNMNIITGKNHDVKDKENGRKVLVGTFHLNGHTLEFNSLTKKLEPLCTA